MRRIVTLALSALLLPALCFAAAEDTTAVGALRAEATALEPLMKAKLTHRFLDATAILPHITPRTVWFDSARTHYWNAAAAATLPDTMRARLVNRTLDEAFYYNTRYGIAARLQPARSRSSRGHGFSDVAGASASPTSATARIGHLRLLASLGADADGHRRGPAARRALRGRPATRAPITGPRRQAGRVTLVHGRWPARGRRSCASVGGGYDLFISKNTLKNGYIHPAQPVESAHARAPGRRATRRSSGELCRIAQAGRPRAHLQPVPRAGAARQALHPVGRRPLPVHARAVGEAGFQVLDFRPRRLRRGARDGARARLGPRRPSAMDLEHDLFGHWTLAKRRR